MRGPSLRPAPGAAADSLEGRLTDPHLDEQVHEVVRQALIEAEATTLDSVAAWSRRRRSAVVGGRRRVA